MCRGQIQSYFLIGQEDLSEEEDSANQSLPTTQPMTWRQRLAEFEHRMAMAMGLQENN